MTAAIVQAAEERRGPDLQTYAIDVANVSKAYKIYERPIDFLKESLTGRVRHRERFVLKDVSLRVGRGEVVGIIGRNGAGKSTLLKIIAGTLAATSGKVTVNGRVSAILELGTGFNAQYSGRDNVILSGLMRGLSEQAIKGRLDSIVEFAGLSDVIDQPFHTYSSGMQARLAFAAAIAVDAEILIIDEALAVGDARFVARSLARVYEICRSGVTALFVSHQTYHVMQLCTRALWIDEGRVRMEGPAIDVARAYEYEMHEAVARDQSRQPRTSSRQTTIIPSTPMIKDALEEQSQHTQLPLQPKIPDEREHASELIGQSAETGMRDGLREGPGDAAKADCMPPAVSEFTIPNAPDVAQEGKKRPTIAEQHLLSEILLFDKDGKNTNRLRFGEVLRMRVGYRRRSSHPDHATADLAAIAVTFRKADDPEPVMYFRSDKGDEVGVDAQSSLPESKDEDFGCFDIVIDPLQLRAGEYKFEIDFLENGLTYRAETNQGNSVIILPNGYDEPAVFYPVVKWSNLPLAG